MRPRLSPLIGSFAAAAPNTVCDTCAGFVDLWRRYFGHFESSRHFLPVFRQNTAAPPPSHRLRRLSFSSSAAENAWMRVCACMRSFSSGLFWTKYTYHIHRYNAPRLGLVHRVYALRTKLADLLFVKNCAVSRHAAAGRQSEIDGGLKWPPFRRAHSSITSAKAMAAANLYDSTKNTHSFKFHLFHHAIIR